MEFGKDGFSITFGLDGGELAGNDVEGLNDLGGLDFSLFEGFMIGFSGVSHDLFLLVQDVELLLLAFDLGFELVGLVGQGLDLVGGFGDFVGGEVDSSVVSGDLG